MHHTKGGNLFGLGSLTEKKLIQRCQKGDRSAFNTLYDIYSGKMLGVCFRYVNDRETARDLMHDGFITVFTKIGDYRGEGSFEGWMRRIFVTTALGYLRRNGNLSAMRNTDDLYGLTDGDHSAIEKMSADELLKTIGELPDGYRTVLNLYAVEGYSHKEIAEMLKINEGTSRSQYARAKSLLYKKINE